MFCRATFGERLENEKMHNIKVSGSRGSREMTFVVGKVRLLTSFDQTRTTDTFIILSFFFRVEKTTSWNKTPQKRT